MSWADDAYARNRGLMARRYGDDAVQDAYLACASRPRPRDPDAYFRTAVRTSKVNEVRRERLQKRLAKASMPPHVKLNKERMFDETPCEILLRKETAKDRLRRQKREHMRRKRAALREAA